MIAFGRVRQLAHGAGRAAGAALPLASRLRRPPGQLLLEAPGCTGRR
ncbi:hypothetical protein [Nonomuraea dietziae]